MTDPLQTVLDKNGIDEDPGDVAGKLVDSTNDAIERPSAEESEVDPRLKSQ